MTDIDKLVLVLSKIEKDLYSIDISLGIMAGTIPPREGFDGSKTSEIRPSKLKID